MGLFSHVFIWHSKVISASKCKSGIFLIVCKALTIPLSFKVLLLNFTNSISLEIPPYGFPMISAEIEVN